MRSKDVLEKLRNCFVSELRGILGTPYIWGGNTPETGLDCSGAIIWCLRRAGYSDMPDMTAKNLCNYFGECPPDLKPGSLIFYGKNWEKINHVMAVLDVWKNGKIIVAGAMHGDSSTTDLERAYEQKAMIQLTTGNYREKEIVLTVDPFSCEV